ncbi:MAG: helix-turn-helix domain-containing protein [Deltaproteobacteria bacterium]|nr:helix-turn-helix domain-containing protein [Deltaproteobacteria bacterium]
MSVPRVDADHTVAAVLPPIEAVDTLAPEVLVDFATQTAALHARAMARLTTMGRSAARGVVDDECLTAEEVATHLQVSPEWVYKQAAKWSFAMKLAPKVLRIQRAGLLRWMAQRRR